MLGSTESAANISSQSNFFFDSAIRAVECGCDIVLIVDNISKLFKAYNFAASEGKPVFIDRVDGRAVQRIKKIMTLSKNTLKGSLTIIALANDKSLSNMDNYIFGEIAPLADKII